MLKIINRHYVCFKERMKSVETSIFAAEKQTFMYPAEIVLPMKAELTDNGFDEMTNREEVESTLQKSGTTLVVINSVCGCAAGTCRPGVLMAVKNAT